MSKNSKIEELYEEAINCLKYSKSKTKVKFWGLTRRLEKLLVEQEIKLSKEKREKLNMAKKKFA